MKHLGNCFDLHISSRELVFPHHENENAIAQALFGRPLARCWVHAERVIGDAPSLAALETQGFEGRTIRYWLLSAHYRRPLAYSADRLEDAQRSLQRLDRCVQALRQVRDGSPSTDLDQLMYDLRQGVRRAFDDDLNLPAALVALFQAVKRINSLMANGRMDARGAGRLIALLRTSMRSYPFSSSTKAEASTPRLANWSRRASGRALRTTGCWPTACGLNWRRADSACRTAKWIQAPGPGPNPGWVDPAEAFASLAWNSEIRVSPSANCSTGAI